MMFMEREGRRGREEVRENEHFRTRENEGGRREKYYDVPRLPQDTVCSTHSAVRTQAAL